MSNESTPGANQPDKIEKHAKRISNLSRMSVDKPHGLEGILDSADASYVLAHDAGIMRDEEGKEEPFVYPSVLRKRLYHEAINQDRPPTFATKHVDIGWFFSDDSEGRRRQLRELREFRKPEVGLLGCKTPYAILENIDDNDSQGNAYTEAVWLACESQAVAENYVQSVGGWHEEPGPGEGDGVYTVREVIKNPHYKPDGLS